MSLYYQREHKLHAHIINGIVYYWIQKKQILSAQNNLFRIVQGEKDNIRN